MKTIKEKTPSGESVSIATIQPENTIVNFNVESLMAKAIENGLSPETMEKFLAMRQQLKAEWAKEQFDKAMAKFQSECPTIVKTKGVKTKSGAIAYKYAPIESIVEQVKEPLQDNGFSYSTRQEFVENMVKISVKVTHSSGHSEVTEMTVPLGTKTDIMSQSQVVAAASTFAKRYAFCNAFGILTGDEDTDAAPTDSEEKQPAKSQDFYPPSEKQIQIIEETMEKKGVTKEMLISDGFDLKRLTGGREGTASELIQHLFDYTPAQSTFVAEKPSFEPVVDHSLVFIKRLDKCVTVDEFNQIIAEVKFALELKNISVDENNKIAIVAKKVMAKITNKTATPKF